MKLENQVCNLLQAKRLKELGISQQGYFAINEYKESTDIEPYFHNENAKSVVGCWNGFYTDYISYGEYIDTYSAFTVAELDVMLPHGFFCVRNSLNEYGISHGDENEIEKFVIHSNAASAMAECVICLLEHGEITITDCNERLKNS